MQTSTETLRARAAKLLDALGDTHLNAKIGTGNSQIGGGSLPRTVIPSVTLDLRPQSMSLTDFVTSLRKSTPPVVGYVSGGAFKIDLRTVFESQDQQLIGVIRSAIGGAG